MSFHRLGEILPQALAGLGIQERVRRERAARAWPIVVRALSEPLAAETTVAALEGTTLIVEVESEEARAFVVEHAAALLSALHAETGEPGVATIQVRNAARERRANPQ